MNLNLIRNYGITTKPFIEWEYVVNPDPNKEYFGEATPENSHGRTRQTVDELMAKPKIVQAQLSREEPTPDPRPNQRIAAQSTCLPPKKKSLLQTLVSPTS